jgi:hypothetical protein
MTTCSHCGKPCDLTWSSPHRPECVFCTRCFISTPVALSPELAAREARADEQAAAGRWELALPVVL